LATAASSPETASNTISRPPTALEVAWDRTFLVLTHAFAWLIVLLVIGVVLRIAIGALPSIRQDGLGFLTGQEWDTREGYEQYGILPAIWGTLYSSFLALIVGTVFGVAVAVFLSEKLLSTAVFNLLKVFNVQFHPFWGSLPDRIEGLLKNLVELLAAIPSVVYGLWGIFVVIPMIQPWCEALTERLWWLPIFGEDANGPIHLGGPALLPAALVLAIMILPTISAISRDALVSVPPKLREAAYGLGATRWEAVMGVTLPTAAGGIFGSIILGFGRALGETMALAMLAGGGSNLSWSLFKPVNTLAALLANNFSDVSGPRQVPSLMYAALVLLGITLVVNMLGAFIVQRAAPRTKGAR
jgi:phosphate transport system permease protein